MDLKKYMDSHPTIVKNPSMIKRFMHQMLCGIAHCHSHRIMHRDLKPANLLLDCHTNTLKLADFGMARAIQIPIRAYSHEVVALGYRAPEIFLGLQNYSLPVDVWSAGCIFAELLRGELLFSGSSQISHIFGIFRLLGTPNEESWLGVCSLSHFQPIFPQWCPQDLQTEFPGADPDGIDLLSRMLQLDPSRRITAKEALSHRYGI
ncbi:hypothetical protein SAY87_002744 [Trapa incisa]|uniref:cyclin-dependent kinase n=1 Tax=Trapa incisa TaxID=236973 RepID=A0AAN7Q0N2_9MYRT|nr:hypothetical protein SAY87_002744 [Trapa incisa]